MSHIHVRDELSDAEGRLGDVAQQVNGVNKDRGREMETLREEDEDAEQAYGRKSFKPGPPPDQANPSRAGLPVYPPSDMFGTTILQLSSMYVSIYLPLYGYSLNPTRPPDAKATLN